MPATVIGKLELLHIACYKCGQVRGRTQIAQLLAYSDR
jgi:hypothetical protein